VSADGKKDPVMPLYGRDLYEDEAVVLMTLEEEAVYVRLLWHAWREGSIPEQVDQIAHIVAAKCPRARFLKLWPAIAPKWIPNGSGRLTNKRLEHERALRRERAEKLSQAGANGNAKRWGDRATRSRSPGDPSHGDRDGIASHPLSPSPSPSTSIPPPLSGGSEGVFSEGGGGGERGSESEQPSLFAELCGTSIRSKSKNRRVVLSRMAAALSSQGMKPLELRALWQRARQESEKDPGGLLLHWIENGWREKVKNP
jgi:uncharacterized protein YdaU (DUF1376 family)